jgi:fructokinase
MATPIRVAVAGEALIDLIGQADGRFEPCLGGAPYNLSRALARQGIPTLFLNPFSSDRFGRALSQQLVSDGVVLAQALPVQAPTSLAVVNLNEQGHPDYAFYRQGVADRQTNACTLNSFCLTHSGLQVVCTGALALDPLDADVYLPWLSAQRAMGMFVVIDANLRPAVIPRLTDYCANVHRAFSQADLIKVSDEDLAHLRVPGHSSIEQARQLFLNSPAELILLTLGAQGSFLLTRDLQVIQAREPAPLQVKDTVGAGDSFLAGFLSALVRRLPGHQLSVQGWGHEVLHALPTLMRHAVASASYCVEQQGCVPPNWDEVQTWVSQRPAVIN